MGLLYIYIFTNHNKQT